MVKDLGALLMLISLLCLFSHVSGNLWHNPWKHQRRVPAVSESSLTHEYPRFIRSQGKQLPGMGNLLAGMTASALAPEINLKISEDPNQEIQEAIVAEDSRSLRRALADFEEKEENDLEGLQEISAGNSKQLKQIAKMAKENNELLESVID